jgi:hypothetical protein
MNSEPWYRSRIPVRRLGTLHGETASRPARIFLSGPPGRVDSSSTELGPGRETVRVSGESVSYAGLVVAELLGSFRIDFCCLVVVLCYRCCSAVVDGEVVDRCLGPYHKQG